MALRNLQVVQQSRIHLSFLHILASDISKVYDVDFRKQCSEDIQQQQHHIMQLDDTRQSLLINRFALATDLTCLCPLGLRRHLFVVPRFIHTKELHGAPTHKWAWVRKRRAHCNVRYSPKTVSKSWHLEYDTLHNIITPTRLKTCLAAAYN